MFFGREEQMEQLESLWGKRVSSLVTCRGRKSTLVAMKLTHPNIVTLRAF